MSVNQNLSAFAKTLNANGDIDSTGSTITADNFLFANGEAVGTSGTLAENDPVFTGELQGPTADFSGSVEAAGFIAKGADSNIVFTTSLDAQIGEIRQDGTDMVVESAADLYFTGAAGVDITGDVYVRKGAANNVVWHAGNDGAASGLDADLLDGQEGTYYLDAGNLTGTVATGALSGTYSINISGSADRLGGELPAFYASNTYMQSYVATEIAGKLDSSSYTAADVFSKVLTQDGTGSTLDADLLDGLEATSFLRTNADTSFTGAITGTGSINISGTITGPTTDTLLVKDSTGSTLKTIRGV